MQSMEWVAIPVCPSPARTVSGSSANRGLERTRYQRQLRDLADTLAAVSGQSIAYESVWYEFLARHYVTDKESFTLYEELCRELEAKYVPQVSPGWPIRDLA